MNQKNEESVKVQLLLTKEYVAKLKRLQKRIQVTSQADAVRFAISIVNQILDEIEEGKKLCFETPEKEIVKVMIPYM